LAPSPTMKSVRLSVRKIKVLLISSSSGEISDPGV
jgi:hypothetical protein